MKPSYIQLPEARSTNTYLSTIASTTAHGTVVYTLRQTAGRGQRGNSWESEDGKNITFSMLIRPSVAPSQQFFISEAAALAVARTLDKYIADGGVSVKWPNDVYWHDKKICGMLIEHSLSGGRINSSILGIGVNINQQQFLSDAPNPVSLWQIIGRETPLEEVLHTLCDTLLSLEDSLPENAEAVIPALVFTSNKPTDFTTNWLGLVTFRSSSLLQAVKAPNSAKPANVKYVCFIDFILKSYE